MARRHANRAVSRRGPKNNLWTVVKPSISLASGLTSEISIVQDSDWERGASLEHATVLRVRGWMGMLTKIATGVSGTGVIFAYIAVQSEDAASDSAALVGTYADNDILWTGGWHLPFTEDLATQLAWNFTIDVKSMRKIHTGQELRLVVTNSNPGALAITGVVRALLRIGGN